MKTDKHGTEFVIAWIPLGGYVKMLDERVAEVAPERRHLHLIIKQLVNVLRLLPQDLL